MFVGLRIPAVLKASSAPADPERDISVSSAGMTQGRDVGASEIRSGAPPPAGQQSGPLAGGDSVGAVNRAITRPHPMESGREAGADAKKGGSLSSGGTASGK